MSERARVDSIDAIRQFKIALWKFQESANAALGDAEGELQRVLVWLETEQHTYWSGQIRKRHDAVEKAKEAVRHKKIFRDATGSLPSAAEEEKALAVAQRRLVEAEQKLVNVRRYTRVLQKEIQLYKGSVQRFASDVQSDLPAAAAHLESLTAKLDAYVSLTAGQADISSAAAVSGMSMARAEKAEESPPLRYNPPDKIARAGAQRWEGGELPLPAVTLEDDHKRLVQSFANESSLFPSPGTSGEGQGGGDWKEADNPMKPPLQPSPGVPGEGEKVSGRVVIGPVAGEAPVYFHRLATDAAGDSGWYFGPADGSTPQLLWSVSVNELLEQRPELKPLLALPVKFSGMIDDGGLVAVWNDRGVRAWGR